MSTTKTPVVPAPAEEKQPEAPAEVPAAVETPAPSVVCPYRLTDLLANIVLRVSQEAPKEEPGVEVRASPFLSLFLLVPMHHHLQETPSAPAPEAATAEAPKEAAVRLLVFYVSFA
jgi:hypothetical protein